MTTESKEANIILTNVAEFRIREMILMRSLTACEMLIVFRDRNQFRYLIHRAGLSPHGDCPAFFVSKTEKKMQEKSSTSPSCQAIDPGKMYSFENLREQQNIGPAMLRGMRRAGLKVHYVGRSGYVMGADLISHIQRKSKKKR